MLATVETIEQISDVCPAQWEGKLTDGRTFYIRYRWGYLTFRVSEKPTDNIKLAVRGEIIADWENEDNPFDGFISLPKVADRLVDIDFSKVL